MTGKLEGSGSDDLYLELASEALTGRSVTTGPDPMPGEDAVSAWLPVSSITVRTPTVTLRPPKGHPARWYYDWDEIRGAEMSWPLLAQMAVVALRLVETRPGDERRLPRTAQRTPR